MKPKTIPAARERFSVGEFLPLPARPRPVKQSRKGPPMHEISLTRSLIGIVGEHARREGFSRVNVLKLSFGRFSCLDPGRDTHMQS